MSIHAGGLGSSFSGSKSFRSCAGSIPSNTLPTPSPPSPMPITLCQPTPYHAHARTQANTHTHTQFKRATARFADCELPTFGGTCCLHLRGARRSRPRGEKKELAVSGTAGTGGRCKQQREELLQVVQLKVRTRKSRNQRTLHGALTHRQTDVASLKKCSTY